MQSKNFARFFIFILWSIFTMYFTMYVVVNGDTFSPQRMNYVHELFGILYTSLIMGGWGFFFSTSQSSAEKDDTIKKLATPQQP